MAGVGLIVGFELVMEYPFVKELLERDGMPAAITGGASDCGRTGGTGGRGALEGSNNGVRGGDGVGFTTNGPGYGGAGGGEEDNGSPGNPGSNGGSGNDGSGGNGGSVVVVVSGGWVVSGAEVHRRQSGN